MGKEVFKEKYLSGKYLYGNDFTVEKIQEWYEDEAEGYADLGSKNREDYKYIYHEWNKYHGYSRLNRSSFDVVVGLGSAYGEEFVPIESLIKRVTIVDPSSAFKESILRGLETNYVKPSVLGELSIESNSVDLVTSFGVLHHIPNVSKVVEELSRVLKQGGIFLIREPIVSLGDWRNSRKGLTKRERGIPLKIMRSIVKDAGFEIVSERLCGFSLTTRILKIFTKYPYNNVLATRVDYFLCKLFSWNINYHPFSFLDRIRPMNVFLVLRRI